MGRRDPQRAELESVPARVLAASLQALGSKQKSRDEARRSWSWGPVGACASMPEECRSLTEAVTISTPATLRKTVGPGQIQPRHTREGDSRRGALRRGPADRWLPQSRSTGRVALDAASDRHFSFGATSPESSSDVAALAVLVAARRRDANRKQSDTCGSAKEVSALAAVHVAVYGGSPVHCRLAPEARP